MDDIKYTKSNYVTPQFVPKPDYGTPKVVSDKQVTLNIDGVDVTVAEGTSIMHAAQLTGVTVPKLCATDSLEPCGSFRLWLGVI